MNALALHTVILMPMAHARPQARMRCPHIQARAVACMHEYTQTCVNTRYVCDSVNPASDGNTVAVRRSDDGFAISSDANENGTSNLTPQAAGGGSGGGATQRVL